MSISLIIGIIVAYVVAVCVFLLGVFFNDRYYDKEAEVSINSTDMMFKVMKLKHELRKIEEQEKKDEHV